MRLTRKLFETYEWAEIAWGEILGFSSRLFLATLREQDHFVVFNQQFAEFIRIIMRCLNFRRKYVNILHPEAISTHLNETASLLLPLYYFWSNKVDCICRCFECPDKSTQLQRSSLDFARMQIWGGPHLSMRGCRAAEGMFSKHMHKKKVGSLTFWICHAVNLRKSEVIVKLFWIQRQK